MSSSASTAFCVTLCTSLAVVNRKSRITTGITITGKVCYNGKGACPTWLPQEAFLVITC